MVRTQIQLTEEEAQALKEMATDQRVSVAELIRRSIDTMIRSSNRATRAERRRRAAAVVGLFHSEDRANVSGEHDRYLAEAYES